MPHIEGLHTKENRMTVQELFNTIMALPDGDILNLMQAASELEGTVEERIANALEEVTA